MLSHIYMSAYICTYQPKVCIQCLTSHIFLMRLNALFAILMGGGVAIKAWIFRVHPVHKKSQFRPCSSCPTWHPKKHHSTHIFARNLNPVALPTSNCGGNFPQSELGMGGVNSYALPSIKWVGWTEGVALLRGQRGVALSPTRKFFCKLD